MSNVDSVKARLKNLAVKTKRPFNFLLLHYFNERLLYRISLSPFADRFVLKGGLLIYAIFAEGERPTQDIDFLAKKIINTPEELKKVFAKICEISTDDCVSFDVTSITVEPIREGMENGGFRVKVIGYLGKIKNTLQVDIGFGDQVVRPIEVEYPSLLNMERPKLRAYSRESVISEKLEAMISLGMTNSRMKDFYDIYLLCSNYSYEGLVLYEAISETFKRRRTPLSRTPEVFSEEFPKEKQEQWLAFKKDMEISASDNFAEIIEVIKAFLMPVYQHVLEEKEWFLQWHPENKQWV